MEWELGQGSVAVACGNIQLGAKRTERVGRVIDRSSGPALTLSQAPVGWWAGVVGERHPSHRHCSAIVLCLEGPYPGGRRMDAPEALPFPARIPSCILSSRRMELAAFLPCASPQGCQGSPTPLFLEFPWSVTWDESFLLPLTQFPPLSTGPLGLERQTDLPGAPGQSWAGSSCSWHLHLVGSIYYMLKFPVLQKISKVNLVKLELLLKRGFLF